MREPAPSWLEGVLRQLEKPTAQFERRIRNTPFRLAFRAVQRAELGLQCVDPATADCYFTDEAGFSWVPADTDEELISSAVATSGASIHTLRQALDLAVVPRRPGRPRSDRDPVYVWSWYQRRLTSNQSLRRQVLSWASAPSASTILHLVRRRLIFQTPNGLAFSIVEPDWPSLEAKTYLACRFDLSSETVENDLKAARLSSASS